MHNHRSLLNMDISGGMPAVIIQMLVSSRRGEIRLLPAKPDEWSHGSLEGALCRGGIKLKRLSWHDHQVIATLVSNNDQKITLTLPRAIEDFVIVSLSDCDETIISDHQIRINLQADQSVEVQMTLVLK
jgi:hypothetical protein